MQHIFANTISFYLLKYNYRLNCFCNKSNFLNDRKYKFIFSFIIVIIFINFPFIVYANNLTDKEINPSKDIIHHVGNAYSWTVFKDFSVNLPVILLTNKGIEVFSSKNISNNMPYKGKYYSYKLNHGRLEAVSDTISSKSPIIIDLSITKNVASMFFVALLMLILFISTARSYARYNGRLKGLASVMEPFIIFIRDEIAKPNIGSQNYQKYMPFLLTLFFFICINNLIGLIPIPPGNVNVTGNISVTMALGILSFIIVSISGNKQYWKHIIKPNVPFYLLPIMILVEFIGLLSKPFALIVRLFANITAGHIIILSLIFLIFILKSFLVAPVSILFVLVMYILELLVAFLQAYIFTLLTALFIGGATSNGH